MCFCIKKNTYRVCLSVGIHWGFVSFKFFEQGVHYENEISLCWFSGKDFRIGGKLMSPCGGIFPSANAIFSSLSMVRSYFEYMHCNQQDTAQCSDEGVEGRLWVGGQLKLDVLFILALFKTLLINSMMTLLFPCVSVQLGIKKISTHMFLPNRLF